jgi:2,3-dihydroxyethylbenzene 1,2-dioxygenase
MTGVTELGYLGLSVSNLDQWCDYAGKIMGMEVVDEGEADRRYLRMDEFHHRIALHEDGGDDLKYLGWRVGDELDLQEMADRLDKAGVPYKEATEAEAADRRVLGYISLEDPGGNPTEIYYGPEVSAGRPFHPGRPMYGPFVTGDQGIGHVIVRETDVDAALDFYRLLGLRGGAEYRLALPDGSFASPIFMHCNDRHHSIAFGLGPMEKRVNHLMIEYSNIDDLGLTHDLVRDQAIDVTLNLGKHANDQAFTFYCANPSGWVWEAGWGARRPPAQREHYRRDIFGHDCEASGYGLDLPLR